MHTNPLVTSLNQVEELLGAETFRPIATMAFWFEIVVTKYSNGLGEITCCDCETARKWMDCEHIKNAGKPENQECWELVNDVGA